ncbi:MAG: polysaccharide deacetylase family protein, partial [Thermodesulfovibrionia bacterium]|nr:polysaccharide deacetylase family protein [Thermodesulfovibrionia bacterium]
EITISYRPLEDLYPTRIRSIINVFNSHQLSALDGAEKSINLFEWRGYSIPLIGNQVEKSALKGWKINQKGTYYQKGKSGHWLLPFDIFLNVFYHLSRYEEKWRHFTDETVTDYSSSILSRYEKLHVPVVDVIITYLDDIIQERLKVDKKVAVRVLPWPNGEEMGVALTHDVDITRGVHLNERVVKKSQGLIYRLLGNDISYARINDSIREKDEHAWSFPELISTYKALDYRATFFFLAKMMEGRHFRYNILSKKFKILFKDLSNAGHEISLHPSKFAFDRPKYYREEKENLESAIGGKVTGMRQHYLRAKFPRLWILAEKAGLSYDSSLGYNYQAGFRAGTTHPFQTFDELGESPLSLTEFSLHLFEYNLPEKSENMTESKKTIDRLIDEVARYGGLLVALLHPSNFQKQPFNEIWNYLLGELKKREVFAGTLSEHVNWRRKRDRIKVKIISIEKSDKKLQISMPDGINHLAVELFSAKMGDVGKNVTIGKLGGSSYTISTRNKNISIPLEIKRSL